MTARRNEAAATVAATPPAVLLAGVERLRGRLGSLRTLAAQAVERAQDDPERAAELLSKHISETDAALLALAELVPLLPGRTDDAREAGAAPGALAAAVAALSEQAAQAHTLEALLLAVQRPEDLELLPAAVQVCRGIGWLSEVALVRLPGGRMHILRGDDAMEWLAPSFVRSTLGHMAEKVTP